MAGQLWIGTRGAGSIVQGRHILATRRKTVWVSDGVQALFIDRRGMWIATRQA